MRIYFIRHAQSENNVIMAENGVDQGDVAGKSRYENSRYADAPLSETGRKQAAALGHHIGEWAAAATASGPGGDFNDFRFTHLYVSPMIRALDTAAPLAAVLELQPVVTEDLCEQGGIWQLDTESGQRQGLPGPTPAALRQRHPSFVFPETLRISGWWDRPYEEPSACYLRSGQVVQRMLAQHGDTDHRVAMVSHSHFFNCFLYQLFQLPPSAPDVRFAIHNASITRIDFDRGGKRLSYHNRVDFLPPIWIT